MLKGQDLLLKYLSMDEPTLIKDLVEVARVSGYFLPESPDYPDWSAWNAAYFDAVDPPFPIIIDN